MVRPRGWHLDEKHVRIDGAPMSASLFDLGLFAFHNADVLAAKDRGPYFYLPKLQSMEEAQLWNDVLDHIERALGLPPGQIKVTVLIETLPAAFEMDEILHALRSRIAGLNCGRWDYIFSYLKTFRAHRDKVLPERGQVTMTQPFLRAYSRTADPDLPPARRARDGRHGRADPDQRRRRRQRSRARQGARRQAARGQRRPRRHLGRASGADPAGARRSSTSACPARTSSTCCARTCARRPATTLIKPPLGTITRAGFEGNVEVCVRYLAAWLDGNGCVPIHWLMEDAATAEIARTQLWQWLHCATRRACTWTTARRWISRCSSAR